MDEKFRPRSVAEIVENEVPGVRCWIEPNVLPIGGKLLFGGLAKIGKSLFACEIARSLVLCCPPFGAGPFSIASPCKVLLLEQEVGEQGLSLRMRKILAGINPDVYRDRFFFRSSTPELKLSSNTGRDILRYMLDEVQPNVLIIDPIGKCHLYDENSAQDIESLWAILEKLMVDYSSLGLSVIISHHSRKPPQDKLGYDALDAYNFSGSAKWFNAVDTAVTMARVKSKEAHCWYLDTRWVMRHGEPPEDIRFCVNRDDDLRVKFEGYCWQIRAQSS